MLGEILSLGTMDIRVHFSVVERTENGVTGQWIKGTATVNPGPVLEGEQTGFSTPETSEEGRAQVIRVETRNSKVIPYLFKERQHEVLMPRPDLGGQDDTPVPPDQAAADIGTMQAITYALWTSLNLARR